MITHVRPRVEFEMDPNLALFFYDNLRWATNTAGLGDTSTGLILENDDNLASSTDGKEIWSANTKQTVQ